MSGKKLHDPKMFIWCRNIFNHALNPFMRLLTALTMRGMGTWGDGRGTNR